jgi:hypothetical protein
MDVDPAAPPSIQQTATLTRTVIELAKPPLAPASQVPIPEVSILQTTTPARSPIPFSLHRIPEDQTGAAKEAMMQAEHMMQRTKEVYEASKLAYDVSTALRANVQVSALVSAFFVRVFALT